MADTTARTMRLLTLLQRRRYWPGAELADQLGVSARTLRRDVERLRELGYAVVSNRGVDGGYQLESASGLASVQVDGDEAVALAVGLHLAAQGSPEMAEISVGTLAKVLALLPPAQRRRAETVSGVTTVGPGPVRSGPTLEVLATVAGACRDGVRLSFGYRAANGAASERYVEPYGLVAFSARYYLVAFDLDRSGWRTFRLDRLRDPRPARNPFVPRALPADDLRQYVRDAHRRIPARYHIVIELGCSGDMLQGRYGRWADIEELGDDRCRVTMDADDFTWALHLLTVTDAGFVVIEPAELRDHVATTAHRFADATSFPLE